MNPRSRNDPSVAAHRAEVMRFVALLGEFDQETWRLPTAPDKWSPAQIAEHIVLYYEAGLRVLNEELRLQTRATGPLRFLLRWVVLPHILFHRSMPASKSPAEIRPSGGVDADVAAERLVETTAMYETMSVEAEKIPDRTLLHPYFGELRPLHFLRVSTVHLAHHRKQLEAVIRPAEGEGRPLDSRERHR